MPPLLRVLVACAPVLVLVLAACQREAPVPPPPAQDALTAAAERAAALTSQPRSRESALNLALIDREERRPVRAANDRGEESGR